MKALYFNKHGGPEQIRFGEVDDLVAKPGEILVKVRVEKFPWKASGRAFTMDAADGLTKLILEPDSGRILGVGVVGRHAEGLIAEGVLAVEMGALAEDLALTIHPHPTLSETEAEAAELFAGSATHLLV